MISRDVEPQILRYPEIPQILRLIAHTERDLLRAPEALLVPSTIIITKRMLRMMGS